MSRKVIDLKGKKFGKLTVIKKSNKINISGDAYWDCECECGEKKTYRTDTLRKTNIQHCGCGGICIKIGDRVGRLTVAKKIKRDGKNSVYWECLCDCGNNKKIILSGCAIKNNKPKSCGCSKNPIGKMHYKYSGYKDMSGKFFYRIKKNAEVRNIEFKITKKQIWDLLKQQDNKCALSGMDLHFGVNSKFKEKKIECTASLDRIDNTKGYIKENVQWLHKHINIMKRNHSQKYFLDICRKIAKKG